MGDRPCPGDFDPYFNQPKIYRQPRYYEYTSKKRKGNKVFKTTKVKDEYRRTVYKKTTSHKRKRNSPRHMKFRFFVSLLLLSLANVFASDLDFTLVNRTARSFEGLYVTDSGNKDWDANILLDGKVLGGF